MPCIFQNNRLDIIIIIIIAVAVVVVVVVVAEVVVVVVIVTFLSKESQCFVQIAHYFISSNFMFFRKGQWSFTIMNTQNKLIIIIIFY